MGTGKKRANTKKGQPERPYQPPPEHACDIDEHPIDLGTYPDEPATDERHVLYYKARLYRGKVVWFSIEQTLKVDGDSFPIVRIDTCHGTVHRHTFTKRDPNGTTNTLVEIPEKGHDLVDAEFERWLNAMLDDWEDNVRRWRTC